jgi:hypothetical protein
VTPERLVLLVSMVILVESAQQATPGRLVQTALSPALLARMVIPATLVVQEKPGVLAHKAYRGRVVATPETVGLLAKRGIRGQLVRRGILARQGPQAQSLATRERLALQVGRGPLEQPGQSVIPDGRVILALMVTLAILAQQALRVA